MYVRTYTFLSDIDILGWYTLTPGIFDMLDKTEPGKNRKIQLTDAIKKLSKQEVIYAYNFEGKRYDIGYKFRFLQANMEYALKRENLKERLIPYIMNLQNK